MPAMHDLVLSAMVKELHHKRDIFLRTLSFDMTHEECLHLVAPARHIEILTEASLFANVKSSEDWMVLDIPALIDDSISAKVSLQMRTHAQKAPPLMPRNPWWQFDTDENRTAGAKVIAWMTKRYEIGRRFGTAYFVLNELNKMCESGHHLRYMWPAVLHLCKDGVEPKMDKWKEKHSDYKVCRFTPAVSPLLKHAIQDSAALLTSVALMGEDVPQQLPGYVAIAEYSMTTFKIGDRSVARL
jgi:hypothetical protein